MLRRDSLVSADAGLLRVIDWESVVLSCFRVVNRQQQASETPLIATSRGQREAVRWLSERGASVKIQDQQRKGRTRRCLRKTSYMQERWQT